MELDIHLKPIFLKDVIPARTLIYLTFVVLILTPIPGNTAPDSKSRDPYEMAKEFYSQQSYNRALWLMERGEREIGKDSAKIHFRLSLYLKTNRYIDAIEDAKVMVHFDPLNPTYRRAYGRAFLGANLYEEAKEQFRICAILSKLESDKELHSFVKSIPTIYLNPPRYSLERLSKKDRLVQPLFLNCIGSQGNQGKWDQFPLFAHSNSASLSPDGNTLIFSAPSLRDAGNNDLYISRKSDNGWSYPFWLGDDINTPHNEVTPFLHPNGNLYFSSDGHPGFGGLDVYRCYPQGTGWGKPEHMEFPICSPQDDLYYCTDLRDSIGTLISNRDENLRNFDSYRVSRIEPHFEHCDSITLDSLCFFFSSSGYAVDTQKVDIYYDLGDGTLRQGTEFHHCYEKYGHYSVRISFVDRFTGETVFRSERIEVELTAPSFPPLYSGPQVEAGVPIAFHPGPGPQYGNRVLQDYWYMGDGRRYHQQKVKHQFQNPGRYPVRHGQVREDTRTGIISRSCHCQWIKVTDSLSPSLDSDSMANTYRILLGWTEKSIYPEPSLFNGLLSVERYPVEKGFVYIWEKSEPFDSLDKALIALKVQGFPNARLVKFKNQKPLVSEDQMGAMLPLTEDLASKFQDRSKYPFDLDQIFFEIHSTTLPTQFGPHFANLLEFLWSNPDWHLEVVLFPEPELSQATAERLAWARMKSLKQLLQDQEFEFDNVHRQIKFRPYLDLHHPALSHIWPNWSGKQILFRWHLLPNSLHTSYQWKSSN